MTDDGLKAKGDGATANLSAVARTDDALSVDTTHAALTAARDALLLAERRVAETLRKRYGKPPFPGAPSTPFMAKDDWQPELGNVDGADGRIWTAQKYEPLEREQNDARRRLADARELERDARDRYLDARRLAVDAATAEQMKRQDDLARRGTEAAEAAAASAAQQSIMVAEQKAIAERSARAAEVQNTHAEQSERTTKRIGWFTAALIVVGILQVVAASVQAYASVHPATPPTTCGSGAP